MPQRGWTSLQLKYRPDIDGLRAVAVLLVIGFHAFPAFIPGGYVGVDIFFVISGFLITGLLLKNFCENGFHILHFYERRIRRIFPALFTVLAFSAVAGWFLLTPEQFRSLGSNIAGGAAFASNFVLLQQSGYFDVSAAVKPLLHLWSLGVEEQYYIFWPLALWLAVLRKRSTLALSAALFCASFVFNISKAGTPAAFYLPFSRAWELMAGGFLAAIGSRDLVIETWLRLGQFYSFLPARLLTTFSDPDVRSWVGLCLIAIPVTVLNRNSQFPGWWALLPTLGSGLIISAEGAWLNTNVLSTQWVVFIGLISYPLYLWHWPLLSFLNIVKLHPTLLSRFGAVAISGALAWLTYHFIERPIRTGKSQPVKVIAPCVSLALTFCVGLSIVATQGFPQRLPPDVREIANVHPTTEVEQSKWRLHTCLLEAQDTSLQFTADCLDDQRPLLFLWGDSFAAALYPGLKKLQDDRKGFGLAQFTSAGCPPLVDFPVAGRPNCLDNNAYVFSLISRVRPEKLLLYSAWNPQDRDRIPPALATLVQKLKQLGISNIFIMGPPPRWDGGEPRAAFDYYTHDPSHRTLPVRSDFRINDEWYRYQRTFREIVATLGVDYISAWDAFCEAKQCKTRVGSDPADLIAYDETHLTISGANYLARSIAACLFGPSTVVENSHELTRSSSDVCFPTAQKNAYR